MEHNLLSARLFREGNKRGFTTAVCIEIPPDEANESVCSLQYEFSSPTVRSIGNRLDQSGCNKH